MHFYKYALVLKQIFLKSWRIKRFSNEINIKILKLVSAGLWIVKIGRGDLLHHVVLWIREDGRHSSTTLRVET